MADQRGRYYSSPERPVRGVRGDLTPPPGQAYFGFPQQSAPSPFNELPGWPPAGPHAPAPQNRPYRAHRSDLPSRIWLHVLGYSLVAIVGVLIGLMVAQQWTGLL